MNFPSILVLAIGLSMDAAAVAGARGLAARRIRARDVALVSGLFGGFQAGMPLIGWMAGSRIGPFVEAWEHWVAFALLGGIGGKMIWEAQKPPEKDDGSEKDPFELKLMLVLAVATSIDAFAVGVTLPMLDAPMGLSVLTIGVTTAILSAIGLWAGRRFGSALGRKLDVVGGVVLIGLGFKILAER
ncbi:MAG: manganese efflux pump MntP family protein [Polyangiaceae bacterium]